MFGKVHCKMAVKQKAIFTLKCRLEVWGGVWIWWGVACWWWGQEGSAIKTSGLLSLTGRTAAFQQSHHREVVSKKVCTRSLHTSTMLYWLCWCPVQASSKAWKSPLQSSTSQMIMSWVLSGYTRAKGKSLYLLHVESVVCNRRLF